MGDEKKSLTQDPKEEVATKSVEDHFHLWQAGHWEEKKAGCEGEEKTWNPGGQAATLNYLSLYLTQMMWVAHRRSWWAQPQSSAPAGLGLGEVGGRDLSGAEGMVGVAAAPS